MKYEKFEAQTKRLRSAYTDKAFNNERIKLIWSHVKNRDATWFERLVDRVIEKERYAPMPGYFAEEARKFRPDEKAEGQSWGCLKCKEGNGILLKYSNTGSPWAFRCLCDAGKSLGPQFNYFNQQVWDAIQNGEIKGVV